MRNVLIPLWFFFGIIGLFIAKGKGRSGCIWFFVGAIFGPIGLIFALIMPRVNYHQPYQQPGPPRRDPREKNITPEEEYLEARRIEEENSLKTCPYCFERINSNARKCKHCKSQLY